MRCNPSYTFTIANASAVPDATGVAVRLNNGDPVITGATGRNVSTVIPRPELKLLSLPALSITSARNVYDPSENAGTVIDHVPLTT